MTTQKEWDSYEEFSSSNVGKEIKALISIQQRQLKKIFMLSDEDCLIPWMDESIINENMLLQSLILRLTNCSWSECATDNLTGCVMPCSMSPDEWLKYLYNKSKQRGERDV